MKENKKNEKRETAPWIWPEAQHPFFPPPPRPKPAAAAASPAPFPPPRRATARSRPSAPRPSSRFGQAAHAPSPPSFLLLTAGSHPFSRCHAGPIAQRLLLPRLDTEQDSSPGPNRIPVFTGISNPSPNPTPIKPELFPVFPFPHPRSSRARCAANVAVSDLADELQDPPP